MSHIDKLATEARLIGVKVVDFDTQMDGISIDIENQRKVLRRYGIKEDKTLSLMLSREEQLRQLSREWLESVDLPAHRDYRFIVLIEAAE